MPIYRARTDNDDEDDLLPFEADDPGEAAEAYAEWFYSENGPDGALEVLVTSPGGETTTWIVDVEYDPVYSARKMG